MPTSRQAVWLPNRSRVRREEKAAAVGDDGEEGEAS